MNQREDALAKANRTRYARARLKEDLRAGRVHIRDVILDPCDEVKAMRLTELLRALPYFGKYKTQTFMRRHPGFDTTVEHVHRDFLVELRCDYPRVWSSWAEKEER